MKKYTVQVLFKNGHFLHCETDNKPEVVDVGVLKIQNELINMISVKDFCNRSELFF